MKKEISPGFRWLVLVTMFVVTATTSIFLIAPAPFIGEMVKTMPGVSTGQVVLMTMISFNILVAVSAILGGPILDKFGVMRVYIAGLIIISIGALLTPSIGSSFSGMFFIRSLQGIGTGPIMVAVLPIAARYFPVKLRSLLIVLQGLAVSSGIALGLNFMPRIFQATQNVQTAMAWLAPICILGLIFSFIVALSEKRPEKDISGIKIPFKKDIMTALSNPVTWVVLGCLALHAWFYQAFSDLVPTYLNAASPVGLGYEQGITDTLMSASSWIFICGGFIGVLITEKFLKGNARPVVLSGFALGAASICLINIPAMASNHMILGTCIVAIAFFSAFIQPQALGYIAKYYPKYITGTIGGLTGISAFAGIAGPMFGAVALQNSGGFQMSFAIMVSVAVIGAIVAIFLKPVKAG
jgi:MFS family permease